MKQKIQIILVLGILIAGIRLGIIFYDRHEAAIAPTKKETAPLNADYYVTPKRLYPYDLKSARQLTKQPVWVRVGYYYPFYTYDSASRHTELAHEAGKLLPLQKLEITDVVSEVSSKSPGQRQILAVFRDGAKSYATPIGVKKGEEFKFYSDDMFFIEDPHQLYKHWAADIWQAIDQHQVKAGMNELQADFAIGIGLLRSGSDSIDRTLDYPNGGNPLTVIFHDGKAQEIKPGSSS